MILSLIMLLNIIEQEKKVRKNIVYFKISLKLQPVFSTFGMIMRNFLLFLILFSSICFSQTSPDLYQFTSKAGEPGISGQVFGDETREPLPARIVLTNSDGQNLASYYSAYPGLFATEDGTFSIKAEPGLYELKVFHGIDYLSQKHKIEIKPGQNIKAEFYLQSWVPLRKMGWVNGDGHAHLYTDKKHDDQMLKTVRQICRAQGVDFICTNQGWAGYGDDDWREGYAKFSDEHFLLYYVLAA